MDEVTSLMAASLRSSIPLLNATNNSLLKAKGKMLRPALCLLAAGAAGGINENSIRFAAASELLHNATLLHDDVVDGSSTRRGKPTVSALLGGSASVLIGDFWLVKAVDCILASQSFGSKVVRIFSKTLSDLAEGEMLQMEKASSLDTTVEDYIKIIYCKTASLFEASVVSGALSASASPEIENALGEYARNLGLAFQIKDDILDYLPTTSLGKPGGVDLSERKITQPLLSVLDRMAPSRAAEVRRSLSKVDEDPSVAAAVREIVLENDGISLAAREMDSYIQKAILSLDSIPDSKEKSYLARLARYVGERDF